MNTKRSLILYGVSLLTTVLLSCDKDDTTPAGLVPQVTSVSPLTGPVGTTVVITGTNFDSEPLLNTVNFGGSVKAEVREAKSTELKVVVPQGAQSGPITITVRGKSVMTGNFEVTARGIASVSPSSGGAGDLIKIKLNNTTGYPRFLFNGTAANAGTEVNKEYDVYVPNSAGDGPIRVEVDGTEFSFPNFNYLAANVSDKAGSTAGYQNGPASTARFEFLAAAIADKTGNIYVGEYNTGQIRRISTTGEVSVYAGSTPGTSDGDLSSAQFTRITGFAFDASGNLYVSDQHRVRKISTTGTVSTIAGGIVSGYVDGTGPNARFNYLRGLCVDASGNIYVTDSQNHKIRKISPAGDVTTYAGTTRGLANGVAASAQFSFPSDIALNSKGELIIADVDNSVIRRISSSGVVSTLGGFASGYQDGFATSARFSRPVSICVDANDNIFIADQNNHRIRKLTNSGYVSTVAGSIAGYQIGSDSQALFNLPTGVFLGKDGELYVVDYYNHKIRSVTFN
ncbi:MAG TPA: IPT/TIG domain-containing protein [Chryseosolibacter sp.]